MTPPRPHRIARKEIYTTGEAAVICSCAPRTISKWFDSGMLAGYRLPMSLDRRIPRLDLVAFLRRHRVPIPPVLLDQNERARYLLIGSTFPAMDRHIEAGMNNRENTWHIEQYQTAADLAFILASGHPDVLLLDISLGLEAIGSILRHSRHLDPVPVALGLASEDDVSRRDTLDEMGCAWSGVWPCDPARISEQVLNLSGPAPHARASRRGRLVNRLPGKGEE